MNTLEVIAAVVGAVSVYLSVRQNIWSWPTAIVTVGLYFFVFYRARLYADAGLQIVYVVINCYGWYNWLYGGKNHTGLKVSRTPRKVAAILVPIVVGAAAALGTLLFRATDAALPYVDSLTTSTSLAAQWMMTRKYLENWAVWIAVDVVYIGMYIHRELYVTALLYFVFLLLCIMGFREWRASLARQAEPAPATA